MNREELAQTLAQGLQQLQLTLSAAQQARLLDYVQLLAKWNGTYNLTAVREPQKMVVHHLLDSLAAMPWYEGVSSVLDVGAGGGLPGLVVAIWAQEAAPALQVSLIDTVHKKTAFLNQVKAELKLDKVTVYTGKVQDLPSEKKFDVITSRAFASLADFVTWSAHLLESGGQFVALKGIIPYSEISALPEAWQVAQIQSLHVPYLEAQRHAIVIRRAS